ncbi:HTH-type transcriptional regulator McbR [Methylococcales bacterium]|nr:HTH-type transcriptional regulator McbR [Methylococcales bacterium]
MEKPETTSEFVRSKLRQFILNEQYAPSERLDQNEIARSLNVSLIPVREGLRMLAAEGLVTITPHRGVYVTELSRDDLLEVYRIRQALEPLAIELTIPKISDQDLEAVESVQRRFAEAANRQDNSLALQFNQEFHVLLYTPAHQPLLLELVSSLALRSTRYRQMYAMSPAHAQVAIEDHNAILAACRARDIDRAQTLIVDHLRHTVEGVLNIL